MTSWFDKKKKMRNLLDNPPESLNFSYVEDEPIEIDSAQTNSQLFNTTEETKEQEGGILIDSYEFGDTPGKLVRYEQQAAEQGGMQDLESVSTEDDVIMIEEVKPRKRHLAKVIAVLAPGSLAIGYSLCYAG